MFALLIVCGVCVGCSKLNLPDGLPVFGTRVDPSHVQVIRRRDGAVVMRFQLPTANPPLSSPSLLSFKDGYPQACSTNEYLVLPKALCLLYVLRIRNCTRGRTPHRLCFFERGPKAKICFCFFSKRGTRPAAGGVPAVRHQPKLKLTGRRTAARPRVSFRYPPLSGTSRSSPVRTPLYEFTASLQVITYSAECRLRLIPGLHNTRGRISTRLLRSRFLANAIPPKNE